MLVIAYQMQIDSALGLCSDFIAHVPPLSYSVHQDVAILHANVGHVCHNMQGSLCRASVYQWYTGEPGGEKNERAANLINIGNGAVQVYLSSAAKQDPKSDDTVLIGPPFYLDLKIAGFSLPIQVCQILSHSVSNHVPAVRQFHCRSS